MSSSGLTRGSTAWYDPGVMGIRYQLTPSGILRLLALGLITGIVVHAFHEYAVAVPVVAYIVLISALVLGAVFDSGARRVFALCGALAVFGFMRYDTALAQHPARMPLPEGEMQTFAGTVIDEPYLGIGYSSMKVEIVIDDMIVPVRVQASFPLEVRYGDTVTWQCALERTVPEGRFSYDDWLFVRGVGATCFIRGSPDVVASAGEDGYAILFRGKDAFRARMRTLFPEPDASFLLGLLLGDRQGLTVGMKDAFRDTGTTHVLAVSGYNVIQVTRLVMLSLALVGILRRRAALGATVAVAAFVVLVGADASVVRAGIMGSIGLVAVAIGRRYSGANAILLAAACMLAANPLLLRHDVGFLLSFTSLLGLQMLAAPLARAMGVLPEIGGVRQVIAETTAAVIATFPLTIFAFGTFAPAALPANALILPLIPLATVLGMSAWVTGVLSSHAGMAIALITAAILRIIRTVIGFAAAISPAFSVIAGPAALFVGYASIILLWYALTRVPRLPLRRPRLPENVTVTVHDAQ